MSTIRVQKSFTVTQSAELLSCSKPTIYRMLNDGRLNFFTIGRNGTDKRILENEIMRLQGVVEDCK